MDQQQGMTDSPSMIEAITPLVGFLAGIALCAFVFSGSKRGGFKVGWDGVSGNFEK